MKKKFAVTVASAALLCICGTLGAWNFNTHRDSVLTALQYMSANGNSNQQWAASYLKYRGGSDIAAVCGQKDGDTDNFYDTSVGGWWIGYRTHVSLLGFNVNYTSFWHFINMSRPGHSNNAYDGYSYRYSFDDGFFSTMSLIKNLLYNQDTRNSGNAGNNISYPEYGQGARDAYRFRFQLSGSQKYYSSTSGGNYDDFQDTVYEPSTNAAAYWYGKALYGRDASNADRLHIGYLGHVLHLAEDANVTQHVWDTTGSYHTDYEGWMDTNHASLYDPSKVAQLINDFNASYGITSDEQLKNVTLQQIMSFFAAKALNQPGPLYSQDDAVRRKAGYEEYNGSVAINVIILEKYIYDLYVASNYRRF